jgi:hypothetical protein
MALTPYPPTPPCRVMTAVLARRLPSAAAGIAFAFMPRRNPPPDISDIDPVELQLETLAVLEERLGPGCRRIIDDEHFSKALELAGGARVVLLLALARIRQRDHQA